MTSALSGLRIVDCTGGVYNYCGKLFAELGADVTLIEPPEGTELRHQPPFLDDVPGVDRSLRFAYYNSSKSSVVIDPDCSRSLEKLSAMIAECDVLLVGGCERLDISDLEFESASANNGSLVAAYFSSFGLQSDEPRTVPEIVSTARSGFLSLSGYSDGSPVVPPDEQGHVASALFGAVAIMMALRERQVSGQGQAIDVSAQESASLFLENAAQFVDLEGYVRKRTGGTQREAGSGVFACQDGHVFLMAAGIGGNRFWANLVRWVRAEGFEQYAQQLDESLWADREYRRSQSAKARFRVLFEQFASGYSKATLLRKAQEYRVPLGPVNAAADVLGSRQLEYRKYFVPLDVDGIVGQVPGAPYVMSRTPWRTTGRAPSLSAD